MENKDLFGVSVVTLLRFLALFVILIGLAYTAAFAAASAGGWAIYSSVFGGLLLTLFLSTVIYAISYVIEAAGNAKTVFGLRISEFLRYISILTILVGVAYAVFNGIQVVGGWAVTSNIFFGLLLSIGFASILYGTSYIFASKAIDVSGAAKTAPEPTPAKAEPEPALKPEPAKKSKAVAKKEEPPAPPTA
ncbi:MAG: hypothetical protein HN929_10250 [Chloroflexi bacterium]|jgi:hypothetical protein|nr:hypothetical protein [Chloroflexota bacterium]